MTCRRRFLISALLLALFTTASGWAEPQASSNTTEMNDVVTRSELVTDLEKILLRFEQESGQFATKDDLQRLRQMLRGVQLEVDSLGTRTSVTEEQSGQMEERLDHTSRPGF